MALTFTKEERLTSRRDIEGIFSGSRTVMASPLKVHFKPNGLDRCRMVVSVPKRLFRRAVRRNLLKRRIRECWRHLKGNIAAGRSVDIMIVYTSKDIDDYATIYGQLAGIVESICKEG